MTYDWWTLLWGSLLMAYGGSLLVKALFNIDLPIVKIILGLFLMYMGLMMLTGADPFEKKHKRDYKNSYNVLFGQKHIDLSGYKLSDQPEKIAINVTFGNAEVKINPTIPTRITAETAFGKVEFPDKDSVVFGKETRTFGGPLGQGYLDLYVKVKFGNLEFIDSSDRR